LHRSFSSLYLNLTYSDRLSNSPHLSTLHPNIRVIKQHKVGSSFRINFDSNRQTTRHNSTLAYTLSLNDKDDLLDIHTTTTSQPNQSDFSFLPLRSSRFHPSYLHSRLTLHATPFYYSQRALESEWLRMKSFVVTIDVS